MIGTLLIGGVTLWLTGLVICMIDAKRQQQDWVLFVAWLPFAASRYYRMRWEQLWPAVMIQVAGLGLLLVAGLMLSIADGVTHREAQFYFDASQSASNQTASLAREALIQTTKVTDQTPLSGKLSGQLFTATYAELSGGVLHIQQGEGFYGVRAIDVYLGSMIEQLKEEGSLRLSEGEQAVEVVISWREDEGSVLESLAFKEGYSLELDLRLAGDNALDGFMRLILPDSAASYAAGSFSAYASQLRYSADGSLNYAHDSVATLELVASEYMLARYGKNAISEISYSQTVYQAAAGRGETTVLIAFTQGSLEKYSLVFSKASGEWVVLDEGRRVVTPQSSSTSNQASAETELQMQKIPKPSAAIAVIAEPAIAGPLEFNTLVQFSGKQITALKQNGQEKQGVMRGIRKKVLVLETLVGSGKVEVFVKRDELVAIRLKDGTEIAVFVAQESLSAEDKKTTVAPAVEQTPPSTMPAGETPVPQVVSPVAEPQSAIEAAPVVVEEESKPPPVVEQETMAESLIATATKD